MASLTGARIREIRSDLGMDPAQFAQLLGIHPSTLYRWENAGDASVRIEPLQRQLLSVLEQQLAQQSTARARSELGSKILAGLLIGGGMLGLFYLLNAAFGEQHQPGGTKRARTRKGGRRA